MRSSEQDQDAEDGEDPSSGQGSGSGSGSGVNNGEIRQWVFGYGSLISNESRTGVSEETGITSDTPPDGALFCTLAASFGYRRAFCSRSSTGFTALGLIKTDASPTRPHSSSTNTNNFNNSNSRTPRTDAHIDNTHPGSGGGGGYPISGVIFRVCISLPVCLCVAVSLCLCGSLSLALTLSHHILCTHTHTHTHTLHRCRPRA